MSSVWQVHLNRMIVQKQALSLQPSSAGYGLGFKNHTVHKVKPASSAEFGGLRLKDTLLEINGIPLEGMSDRDALDMIKQAAPTLDLVVNRMLPVDPLAEDKDPDDSIFEDNTAQMTADDNRRLTFNFDNDSSAILSPSSPISDGPAAPCLVPLTTPDNRNDSMTSVFNDPMQVSEIFGVSRAADVTDADRARAVASASPHVAEDSVVFENAPSTLFVASTRGGEPAAFVSATSGGEPVKFVGATNAGEPVLASTPQSAAPASPGPSPQLSADASIPASASAISQELRDSGYVRMLKERVASLEHENLETQQALAAANSQHEAAQSQIRAMMSTAAESTDVVLDDEAAKPAVTLAALLLESAKNAIERLTPVPTILSNLEDNITRAAGAAVGLQLAADAQARHAAAAVDGEEDGHSELALRRLNGQLSCIPVPLPRVPSRSTVLLFRLIELVLAASVLCSLSYVL